MDQKRKRIGSALCAALLTVSLNGRVWADGDEQELPLEPPVQIVEDAPSETGETSSETGNDPADLDGDPAEAGGDPAEAGDDPVEAGDEPVEAGDEPAGTDGENDEAGELPPVEEIMTVSSGEAALDAASDSGTQQTEALLVIGDQELDFTEAASGEGWSYDADGRFVYLKGFDGSTQIVGTAGSDLTIRNSGLNRIGTLVVDGDLNLVGSGILLIDSLELAEGKELNLQANTAIYDDKSCSVAVFLKRTQEVTDDEGNVIDTLCYYELINKTMPGVLDEDCVIPEGVTLRLPDNTSLLLQSVVKLTRYTSATETSSQYFTEEEQEYNGMDWWKATAPQLLISRTAKLIVDQLAAITCHAVTVTRTFSDETQTKVFRPSIRVEGDLSFDGSIDGAVVDFGSEGVYEGEGVITNSAVVVRGGRSEALAPLELSGSVLSLQGENALVEDLHFVGDNTLVYTGENTLSSVRLEGGVLAIQTPAAYSGEDVLHFDGTLSGALSGAKLVLQSGILALENSCSISGLQIEDKWSIPELTAAFYDIMTDADGNTTGTGAIYDYRGVMTGSDTPRIVHDPQKSDPNAAIPAEITSYYDFKSENFGQSGRESFYEGSYDIGAYPVSGAAEELSYDALRNYYVAQGKLTGGKYGHYCFLLETEQNGSFGYTVLSYNSTQTVPAGTVTRIRVIVRSPDPMQGGGGTVSDTITVFTGNGNLGQNAGSMTGGAGTPVLSGGGISTPIHKTKPEEPDDPDDPDVPDTPDTPDTPDAAGRGGQGVGAPAAPAFWVEDGESALYVLCAAEGEASLLKSGGRAAVSMSYTLPGEFAGKPLYAVFRNADGSLTAFRASYDPLSGRLSFDSDRLGEFVIVAFAFDGEEFSPAFYEALAALPAVARLG